MTSIKRHRKTGLALVVGLCAIGATGLGIAVSADGDDTPDPLPSRAGALELSATEARETIGQRTFILAPGTGSLARPDVLCLSVEGPGEASVFTCAYRDELAEEGSITTHTSPDGKTEVWGIAPTGATAVSAEGANLTVRGPFFAGSVPSGVATVSFTVEGQSRAIAIRPAA